MEQETKNKKQPNLKRVILWTTLISVVATLVLYYFSYIFPIPAVEIDATGIPQTKEEYEQWYLKKLIIQNAKVPVSELEFGEKIIAFIKDDFEAFIPLKKSEKMPINSTVNTSTIS